MKVSRILDNLKAIFEGKFGDILSNNKITLFDFSKTSNEVVEIQKEGILTIDPSKMTPEQLRLLKIKILDTAVQGEDEILLLDKSKENVESIRENLPSRDDQALRFYKDKLSPVMYKVLEAALVVRNVKRSGGRIEELKSSIGQKYPDIGNNMCNLVSSGYFDNHFKELYYSMLEEDDFDITAYQDKVKHIVKSLPYIVFISQQKTYDELHREVKFKLERLKKYGAGKLVLHALSISNVEKTLDILNEYADDESVRISKEINDGKTIITATLIF